MRKRFGQHFLHDAQVIQALVDRIAPEQGQCMVEIGPGQGALTLPILEKIGQLDVVELDRDLIPILKARSANKGNLIVHSADALKFDFAQLVQSNQKLRVIGNLPYNISTPLIFHLLNYAAWISDMHFMLQKEVVDRLAAQPDTSDYGRLSVMMQYHCQVTSLFNVPPTAFSPPPKVESSVVRLVPYAPQKMPYLAQNYRHFAVLVREAFSHRRKTIHNSLKKQVSLETWASLGIDPGLRPEVLRVEEYVAISNGLQG